jgi:hypothetical protein
MQQHTPDIDGVYSESALNDRDRRVIILWLAFRLMDLDGRDEIARADSLIPDETPQEESIVACWQRHKANYGINGEAISDVG